MRSTLDIDPRWLRAVAAAAVVCAMAAAGLMHAAPAHAEGLGYFCNQSIPAHEVCHGAFGNVAFINAENELGTSVCVNVETFSGGAWHNATPWVCNNGFVNNEISPWVYGSPTILNNSSKFGHFSGLAVYE
jgi:hypothetical protein